MAVAAIVPAHCAGVIEALEAGDLERARELQMQLMDLNAAVTTKYGIPGLKYALDRVGFYGGPCRRPLLALEEQRVVDDETNDLVGQQIHVIGKRTSSAAGPAVPA